MTNPRLSVQLYTVREQLGDLDATLERIAALGVDAVEPFSVLDGDLGRALRRHGLEAPSGQFPFLSDEIDFMGKPVSLPPQGVVFESALAMGVGILIDPMVAPARWTTTSTIDHTADQLNAAAEIAATLGLRVGYHNHAFEFREHFAGVSAYERFAERLDERVVLELDVFWAAAAGEDVPDLIRRLGPRVRALHVKDGTAPLEPFAMPDEYDALGLDQRAAGQGELGVADILEAAAWAELDVVEFDHVRGDVFAAIRQSVDYVRAIRRP